MDRINMETNFQEMTKEELRAYVLAHREDEQAFHAYIDKINAQADRVEHPPLNSIDDMKNYPEFIEKLRQSPEKI